MPRVPSASVVIAEMIKKQLAKLDDRMSDGEVGKEDLDRLEQLARINKLNIVNVRLPRDDGDEKSDLPDDIGDEQLEKELRAMTKAQQPDFFNKRGRKPGPVEPVAPPPPTVCENVDKNSGYVCTLLTGHAGLHEDATQPVEPTLRHRW